MNVRHFARLHISWLLELTLVVALALVAAHPFLTRAGLPRETDAELHVFRAAQLGQALQSGAGYVRWAPDLWYGYGYPIFNYYSPFTYYLANMFALLPGLDVVDGIKAVLILAILLAASGAFWLGRDLFGPGAGLIAATAYIFSPYLLLIDPHIRGDVPEFFALALFPWLLQFLRVARFLPSSSHLLISSLLWAVLILTHNLMALILSVILVAWLLWQSAIPNPQYPIHPARIVKLILATAGLAAFFWLPFIAERSAIRLTVIGAGHFDFHNHFVAWQTLFGPSQPLDLGAATPRVQHALGLAQWLLALPAIPIAWLERRTLFGRTLLFFVSSAILLIFLMLSPSALIWENVPLMPYIQFPWRLLGPTALMLAMCTAGVWRRLTSPIKRLPVYVLLLALALPAMYPPLWSPDFGPTTPPGILRVELAGHYLGTTSSGDFVPSTVKSDPPPNANLIASYERGAVDKFDHSALPPGATATVLEHGPTYDRLAVSSPQAFVGRVLTFYFPGWRAYLDGKPLPIRPSNPYGLIEFDMPAGDHEILVVFGSTLPRTAGAIISLLTLATLAVYVLRATFTSRAHQLLTPAANESDHPLTRATGNQQPTYKLETLVILAFILFKFAVADPCDSCFRYTSPPGQVLGAQYRLDPPVNLGHHILLLGYDAPAQVRSGDALALTLYWQASAPVPQNYQVFAHLVRPAVTLWGQSDKLNPGDAPTTRWPLDKFVWDEHKLRVLPATPPGEYQLSVGLYLLNEGTRVPVFDAQGQMTGDSVILPTPIRVLPAHTRIADLTMENQDNISYDGAVLLGHALESGQVRAPGFVRITLFWQALRAAPAQPAHVRLALVDAAGQTATQLESDPTGGIYPPARWQRGQIVRDIYSLWLADSLAPGVYAVRLTVDDNAPLDLAQVQISK